MVLLVAALCLVTPKAGAQAAVGAGPLGQVRYTPNESGGRIRLVATSRDSLAVQAIRLELLEAAAAIRRGDLRLVRGLRSDSPAYAVLSRHPRELQCTFRAVPGGGELVLLSDDGQVVRAIHTLLAEGPPNR